MDPAAADVNETVGFGQAGSGLEQERVRHGEDRGVGANANGERECGSYRKEWTTSKQPPRLSEISPRIIEPPERPGIAMELFRLFNAAERTPGRDSRLIRRHSAADEVVLYQGEVRGNLAL
jgi:hypothetical protein